MQGITSSGKGPLPPEPHHHFKMQLPEARSWKYSVTPVTGQVNQLVTGLRHECLRTALHERTIKLQETQGKKRTFSTLIGYLNSILDTIQELPNRLRGAKNFQYFHKHLLEVTSQVNQDGVVTSESIEDLRKVLRVLPDNVLARRSINRKQLDQVLELIAVSFASKEGNEPVSKVNLTTDTDLTQKITNLDQLSVLLSDIYQNPYSDSKTDSTKQLLQQLTRSGVLTHVECNQLRAQLDEWSACRYQRLLSARNNSPEHQRLFFAEQLKIFTRSELTTLALVIGLPEGEILSQDKTITADFILRTAGQRGLLSESSFTSAIARVGYTRLAQQVAKECGVTIDITENQQFNPFVAGLRDEDTVPLITATDFITPGTVSVVHLGQVLGLSPNDVNTIDTEYARNIRGCFYHLLHKSAPLTVAKLARIMAHPSINLIYNLEKLRCSRAGIPAYQQVDSAQAMSIFRCLSHDELDQLARHSGVVLHSRRLKQRKISLEIELFNKLQNTGRLKSGNLLYGLLKTGNQSAIDALKEHYPECEPDQTLAAAPAWEPNLDHPDTYTPESPLSLELTQAIPPTQEWMSLAYLTGLPIHQINVIEADYRGSPDCATVALQRLLSLSPEVTIEMLVAACHQLGCMEILRFLPKQLLTTVDVNALRERQTDTLRRVSPILVNGASHWKSVGTIIKLPDHAIEVIAMERSTDREALIAVMNKAQSLGLTVPWDKLESFGAPAV